MNFVFIPQPGSCAASDPQTPPPPRWLPIMAYVVASIAGGAAVASALGWIGTSVRSGPAAQAVWAVAAVAAAAGVAAELTGRTAALPQRRRQVPRDWVDRMGRTRCAIGFGLLLGAGVFTHLHRGSVYVVGALALVAPNVAAAALLGAAYGLGRALPVPFDAIRTSAGRRGAPLVERLGRRAEHGVAAGAAAVFVLWLALSATSI